MKNKEFPNGIESYLETYYEIVAEITQSINLGDLSEKVTTIQQSQGRKGLYDLAQDLTIKFEQQYAPTWFEVYDFYETIDKFLEEELYNADK